MSTQNIFGMTDTWNAGGTTFTAIGMNVTDTASAAASLLIDLQVGGASQFRVSKGGRVTAQTLTIGLGGQTAVATNTALGFEALNSASLVGSNNVGVGYRAGLLTTTGGSNVYVGLEAGRSGTTAEGNVCFGFRAGRNLSTGSYSVAVGLDALVNAGAGNFAVAIGTQALERVATSDNTAIGCRALRGGDATVANNTGINNIAIGYQAGDAITTGSNNLVIGYNMDVDSATGNNQINIGDRYFHDRIRLLERAADPAKPTEGNCVVWMSDGTGLGDDGDVIIASTAGGVTNYAILFDHSAGTLWP